ncbi:MAG: hypothetical protein D3918_17180 [Candidatus Electrothrix sp. AX2]|nr:hypothetical protein [Candidatus Electrothrix gigas]
MAIPEITNKAFGFLVYLAIILTIQWLTTRVVFRLELCELKRRSTSLPLRDFYGQMAEHHSTGRLLLGFITCMLFMACGIWMSLDTSTGQQAIGVMCSILFGACGVAWGFALKLKFSKQSNSEQGSGGNA